MKKRVVSFLPVIPGAFRKLSPRELEARGLSRKAERYIGTTGEVISKRKYQESRLQQQHGKRVTLEQRATNYFSRVWTYLTGFARDAAYGRRNQRKTPRKTLARDYLPIPPKVAAELQRASLKRGSWSRADFTKVGNFMNKYGKDEVLVIVSPVMSERKPPNA